MPVMDKTRRLQTDLDELAGRGLDLYTFATEAGERIRRSVPFDTFCLKFCDPETELINGAVGDSPCDTAALIYRHEYVGHDYATLHELAHGAEPVMTLRQATLGEPVRSPRWREALTPMGVQHEMRGAVRSGDRLWGDLLLYRSRDRDFDADDVRAVEGALGNLGRGLREATMRGSVASVPLDQAPGVFVIDSDNRVVASTPIPDAWLARLARPEAGATPLGLSAMAWAARGIAARREERSARLRMQAADGSWLALHASVLEEDDPEGRVAIVIQPARAADLKPVLYASMGFTHGEQAVCEQVLGGRSTKEIAGALYISPYTVQDRLKSVFSKLGVRSRRELVAALDQRLGG